MGGNFLLLLGLKLSASSCAVDAAQLYTRVQSFQTIIDYEMKLRINYGFCFDVYICTSGFEM